MIWFFVGGSVQGGAVVGRLVARRASVGGTPSQARVSARGSRRSPNEWANRHQPPAPRPPLSAPPNWARAAIRVCWFGCCVAIRVCWVGCSFLFRRCSFLFRWCSFLFRLCSAVSFGVGWGLAGGWCGGGVVVSATLSVITATLSVRYRVGLVFFSYLCSIKPTNI